MCSKRSPSLILMAAEKFGSVTLARKKREKCFWKNIFKIKLFFTFFSRKSERVEFLRCHYYQWSCQFEDQLRLQNGASRWVILVASDVLKTATSVDSNGTWGIWECYYGAKKGVKRRLEPKIEVISSIFTRKTFWRRRILEASKYVSDQNDQISEPEIEVISSIFTRKTLWRRRMLGTKLSENMQK